MVRATQASPGLGLSNLGPVLGRKEAQCLWGPLQCSAFCDYFLCTGMHRADLCVFAEMETVTVPSPGSQGRGRHSHRSKKISLVLFFPPIP